MSYNNIENMIYEIRDNKRKMKKIFNLLLKNDKVKYKIDNNNNAYFKVLECKDYINKEIIKIINKKEKQKSIKKINEENHKIKLEDIRNGKPIKENNNVYSPSIQGMRRNKKNLILYFE